MNAVRTAIKAGVKPTMVARQFGVSLPTLRRILTDDQK
jgi:DNA invertase Pin-like site-specific DNA recombinase